MKHFSTIKMLTVFVVFFVGMAVANAQSAQQQRVAQAPTKVMNLENPTQKVDPNIGYDDNKYAAWQQQQVVDQMAAAGYDPIPGFTYTGDKAVDDAAYEQARIDFQNNDPVGFDQMFRQ